MLFRLVEICKFRIVTELNYLRQNLSLLSALSLRIGDHLTSLVVYVYWYLKLEGMPSMLKLKNNHSLQINLALLQLNLLENEG
jgi:hypothetical protein